MLSRIAASNGLYLNYSPRLLPIVEKDESLPSAGNIHPLPASSIINETE